MTTKTDESVAVAILSEDNLEIALILRRDTLVWALPGGGIDKGETPEKAALREVMEETCLTCRIERKVTTYLPVNSLTKRTHFFLCRVVSGTLKPSQEVKQTRFFPLTSLPKLFPPPYTLWVKDLFDVDLPSEKLIEGVSYTRLLLYFFLHPIIIIRYFLARLKIPYNS